MREIKYSMPRAMYNWYMDADRFNGNRAKLMAYVNATFGLMGTVTEIVIEG